MEVIFIKKILPLLLTCLLFLSITPALGVETTETIHKFELMPLPYAYNALEPYIDKDTLLLHHDKHHKSYVDNLNKALDKYPDIHYSSLEELLVNIDNLPKDIQEVVKNNAGGDYNHNLYWTIMGPNKGGPPKNMLLKAIERDFGSFEKFKDEFKNTALSMFGSGWAWLLSDNEGNLKIISTPNQDTPLPMNLTPIIVLDVWEHAYYLKYTYRRSDYIDNWWNVVNWDQAELNYNESNSNKPA